MASGSATVINVNVGGILYTSTVETLTKEEGSVLHTMFAGGGHTRCAGYFDSNMCISSSDLSSRSTSHYITGC